MRRTLDAANLSVAEIEPAFALIQALHRGQTLDNWRAFASPLVDQKPLAHCGLVGIRNEAGYLCGLFVYHVEADLAHKRAFIVDVIAALDIVGAQYVIFAMMEAAQARAEHLGCGITRVRVTRDQTAIAVYLRKNGFKLEGQLLSIANVA
jgi:hypothetical protein